MPQTTNFYLSVIAVQSPSHSPLYFESFCPSLAQSLYLVLHYISYKSWQIYFSISQLFIPVCCFLLSYFLNPFLFLLDIHVSESLSQIVPVCLFDMWMCWVRVCPGIRQPGAAAPVNESLCLQTRCFVSYDKSVGAQTLPLQLQCWARSQRELRDSGATSGRKLHSLITDAWIALCFSRDHWHGIFLGLWCSTEVRPLAPQCPLSLSSNSETVVYLECWYDDIQCPPASTHKLPFLNFHLPPTHPLILVLESQEEVKRLNYSQHKANVFRAVQHETIGGLCVLSLLSLPLSSHLSLSPRGLVFCRWAWRLAPSV